MSGLKEEIHIEGGGKPNVAVKITPEKCVEFAVAAIDKKDYLAAIHNLNEGLSLAIDREQIAALNEVYIELFETMGSFDNVRDIIARDFITSTEGDAEFVKLDLDTVMPYDDPLEDGEYFDEGGILLDEVYKFSEFRALCAQRKYADAMALAEKFPDTDAAFRVYVDAMIEAESTDPTFDFNRYFLAEYYSSGTGMSFLLPHGGEDYYRLAALMLKSGGVVRSLVVEAADMILESAVNLRDIVLMGKHFFLASEFHCAEIFFKKALEYTCVEANSLYYLTVINKIKGDNEKADEYWNVYKAAFKSFNPPIALWEEFFKTEHVKTPTAYRCLPNEFQKEYCEKFMKEYTAENAEKSFKSLLEFFMLCGDFYALKTMFTLTQAKRNSQSFLVNVLKNTWIPDGLKYAAFQDLIASGYEGQIRLMLSTTFKSFVYSKVHGRIAKSWVEVHNDLIRTLAFSEKYVPIKCNFIAAILKKMYAVPTLREVEPDAILTVLWLSYVKMLGFNIKEIEFLGAFNVGRGAIEKGFMIFQMLMGEDNDKMTK